MFSEGTVLCLEDRTPLGRVTELFGPVQAPLYALRYSGSAASVPGPVAAGAHVCAVEKYASALEAEAVHKHVRFSPERSDCYFHVSAAQLPMHLHEASASGCARLQAPVIEDDPEEDDPSFQFSDDEQARCDCHRFPKRDTGASSADLWDHVTFACAGS